MCFETAFIKFIFCQRVGAHVIFSYKARKLKICDRVNFPSDQANFPAKFMVISVLIKLLSALAHVLKFHSGIFRLKTSISAAGESVDLILSTSFGFL